MNSLPESDLIVSGNITDRFLNLKLNHSFDAFFDEPIQIQFDINGPFDLLKTSMIIPDLNKNIFGYEISNIQSEIELNPDVLAISNMSIDLENSQKLEFEGNYVYSKKQLILKQTGLSQLSKIQASRRIDAMNTDINMRYLNQDWDILVTSNVVGVGAKVSDVDISEYSISLIRDGGKYQFDVNYFYSDGQRFNGFLRSDSSELTEMDVHFSNLQLSNIRSFLPSSLDLSLTGIASGRIIYKKTKKLPELDLALDIQNLTTQHGQFGDVFIELFNNGERYDILNFKLRGLHYLDLTGSLDSFNKFELSPLSGSMIRLDAFNYFAKEIIWAYKIGGTFKMSSKGLEYNGQIESDDFEFDGNRFDYLFSSLNARPSQVDFKRMLVELDAGKMDVNGSVYFLENAKKENNYDIDLDLKFANFDIKHFSNIYKSYLNWERGK